ncbi:MAG: hypothetical protein KDB23_16020 [Planctomycetales bacterium]|nr:hypothetical protein [Planctomycetales bacterium]
MLGTKWLTLFRRCQKGGLHEVRRKALAAVLTQCGCSLAVQAAASALRRTKSTRMITRGDLGRYIGIALWALVCGLFVSTRLNAQCHLASFRVDVTIPLGHRCMGVLPTKSKSIRDRLYANGFVLLSNEAPIVLCALDWCEVRNGAYDAWRDALAKAAGTTRERVLVCSLHQHDAPVADRDAAKLLRDVGLGGELYDEAFHDDAIRRVAAAVSLSLQKPMTVTHLGIGQARVERIASNRRIVMPDGRVTFDRGSRSGGEALHRDAPEGEVDPLLKTISFWKDDEPVLALHAYATHPMSSYGAGEVSSDFVGLAREMRQRDDLSVQQIYVSGCSGDVTAGRYNDGTPESRRALTERLHAAMVAAWQQTQKFPLRQVGFRSTQVELEFHPDPSLAEKELGSVLTDNTQSVETRILAAMGLASRQRVRRGQKIDFPCIDFGAAKVLLFPAESFVGYQLMAQAMCPDSVVMSIGYGECWPGYIPTDAAFRDGFQDKWLWVAPGSEARMRRAIEDVLCVKEVD